MKLHPDQQRVKTLLSDTITLLCKNGLNYDTGFCIEALIGITVDQSQVFLVNINKTVEKELDYERNSSETKPKKRKSIDSNFQHSLINGDFNSPNGGVQHKIPRISEDNGHKLSLSSDKENQHSVTHDQNRNINLNNGPITLDDDDYTSSLDTSHSRHLNAVSAQFNASLVTINNTTAKNHLSSSSKSSQGREDREKCNENNAHEKDDIALQLLYKDDEESDLSNVEHQVTGPPVWPEPTLSFSAGLTLPTVIAPQNQTKASHVPNFANSEGGGDLLSNPSSITQGSQNDDQLPYHMLIQQLPDCLQNRKHCCIVCGKRFKEAWMLRRHMLTHSQPGFFCPTCSKPFKRKDTMKIHMEKHKVDDSKVKSHTTTPVKSASKQNQDLSDDLLNDLSKSDMVDFVSRSVNNAWKHVSECDIATKLDSDDDEKTSPSKAFTRSSSSTPVQNRKNNVTNFTSSAVCDENAVNKPSKLSFFDDGCENVVIKEEGMNSSITHSTDDSSAENWGNETNDVKPEIQEKSAADESHMYILSCFETSENESL